MCDEKTVNAQSGFAIGGVPVTGRVVLAPMSGYNDLPFRLLCKRFGASLVYTGLLSAKSIYYRPRRTGPTRTQAMLAMHPEEVPVVVQLFAEDGDILKVAAQSIEPLGMAMIDINMGCAAPKILKSGSGVALMREPAYVGKIFAGLSRAVSVPVSGKIRLGWDANRNYLDVARAIADNGASLIAVHGRTAEQAFTGEADWDAIARVKQVLDIPVLASGDVKTYADVDRILQATGCDGVMIGRAALGNPWIFKGVDGVQLAWSERVSVIVEHLRMMVNHHGEKYGVSWFRKHLRAYLVGSEIIRHKRHVMMECKDAAQLEDLLQASVT